MTTPQHIIKTHPFAVLTAHTLPEDISPRERTIYGWETLKVKQFIRIPTAEKTSDSAYMSMMNWNKKAKDEWEKARDKEEKRILSLDEVSSIEEEEARNEAITNLMQAWYDEHGEEPPRFMMQNAHNKGKLIKAKKEGAIHEYVDYDDPDGLPLVKDKRDNEKPAFKDFIRVV